MATRGRKPNNPPALAYDYRRALALVQALAIESFTMRAQAIQALGQEWLGDEAKHFAPERMVNRLAQHALKHAREGEE